jgi:S-(hydroxymethyl)glutathione dehydrogenase / alcohol dehydrogenase
MATVAQSSKSAGEGGFLDEQISRRTVLTSGAAAAALGGAANLLGGDTALAEAAHRPTNRPDDKKAEKKWKNRKFRGFVRHDSTADVVELRLIWPIGPRQVLIATEATQACYTITTNSLATTPSAVQNVPGHGGVGIVVYVGEQVRRFQVGDRALVAITPQCGLCYNCLHGRSDMCQFLNNDTTNGSNNPPFARMRDGREVTGGRGGFSELMVVNEEWATPVFTEHPAVPLSLLSCVGATGLGMSTTFVPVEPGCDVVVFGCGPIGLSIINGAVLHSAGQVIAVDPIAYRREVALQIGATTAIDPTGKNDTLGAELREMCKGRTDRYFAGGRTWQVNGFGGTAQGGGGRGPEYVFEATGGQRFDPSVRGIEPQPDPTGILPLQQLWALIPNYGTGITTSVGQQGSVSIPGGNFTNAGKTLRSAQYGGVDLMKDTPRFVTLLERGLYRADLIASATYPLDGAREAIEASAYRTTVSAHVAYDPARFVADM